MPKFKYVGDDERDIPDARAIVKPGDTFEVTDEVAKGLEGQEAFEPVKSTTAPKGQKEG